MHNVAFSLSATPLKLVGKVWLNIVLDLRLLELSSEGLVYDAISGHQSKS